MASKILTLLCIFILINIISTADVNGRRNGKRIVTDPVSDFFSELGDLFLDVDRTFSVQTAPKVEHQDNILSRLMKPSNDYFSNVQENYRTLQSRLGKVISDSIGPKPVYSNRDLSTISPIGLDAFNPTQSSNLEDVRDDSERSLKSITDAVIEESEIESRRECSRKRLDDPAVDPLTQAKCSQRLELRIDPNNRIQKSMEEKVSELKRMNDLLVSDINGFEKSLKDFSKRDGAISEDSKPGGRILGDVMYSESSFDKYVRQLLRDNGKWVLDNPILSRWRKPSESSTKVSTEETTVTTTEKTEPTTELSSLNPDVEPTQAYTTSVLEDRIEPMKSGKSPKNRQPLRSMNYYEVLDEDGIVEEVEIISSPDLERKTNPIEKQEVKQEKKETVILAFTPDGVPLKLRMGPEIENPVSFLHKMLKSAGVSLNVPVESYDDIEPVGKEVMKFGAGVLTRAVYLDLSQRDELKTLLKTLMKSKASGNDKFQPSF